MAVIRFPPFSLSVSFWGFWGVCSSLHTTDDHKQKTFKKKKKKKEEDNSSISLRPPSVFFAALSCVFLLLLYKFYLGFACFARARYLLGRPV